MEIMYWGIEFKDGRKLAHITGVMQAFSIRVAITSHKGLFVDASRGGSYDSTMRTERVEIEQARNQLADLIAFASGGGEVIIVQDGKPLARLIRANDPGAYKSVIPSDTEFASDEDSLAWDADGWEGMA